MGPPVNPELVERYQHTLHLNTLTDYGNFLWWSDVIIGSTNVMHWLINVLYSLTSNYGICIILLTVIVRGAMFPLSRRQMASTMKLQEQMQKIAPQIKELEGKYGHDPLELQRKKNELYVKSGINPLAAMGTCWLLLLQMPIFMGLYFSINESIHFRLAPFLWMQNLAAPDMLVGWGENIPLISDLANMGAGMLSMFYLGPFLNILPIFAVGLMFVQQKMMTPPPTDENQAAQQRMMKWMLGFMAIIFYKMPAGLCLYFIASGLWGLAERRFMPKKQDPDKAGDDDKEQPASKKGGGNRKPRKDDANGNGQGSMQKIKDWWAKVLEEARKKQR
jgi:YidC/Oxa1 family membrane protein insertase